MFTRDEKILVAVSGGKDSLALWDILNQLGYQADGLYIQLGILKNRYSEISGEISQNFANQRGLKLHTVQFKDQYGEDIVEVSKRSNRGKGRPCAVCGLAKRHIMNKIATKYEYSTLVTGHNLDDEAATLLGNTLDWQADMLQRQAPVLAAASGLAKKAKPFCRTYERETTAYMIMNNIDYIYEECPFSTKSKSLRYKNALNALEEQMPGTKLRFYSNFLKARNQGMFPKTSDQHQDYYEQKCSVCDQPTTAPDTCAFCRLMNLHK
ncbi:MAG: adenine nucleotide alpha hydrolase family protein [Anaerolineaceae bacterium]|nr:adenine nucleotide alpha hydrolase family protein [Anaerolineaceae bacterium]